MVSYGREEERGFDDDGFWYDRAVSFGEGTCFCVLTSSNLGGRSV